MLQQKSITLLNKDIDQQRLLRISLEFKIEDLWIGAFWRRSLHGLDVWICLIPCLPIHIFIEYDEGG